MVPLGVRHLSYRLIRAFFYAVFWLLTGVRIEGQEHVPSSGPLLVVSNHLNTFDPAIVGVAVPRVISFMAKIELFRVPLLGGIMRFHLSFPVDRGAADRQAIRMALARLEEGYAVCMFAEGTRSRHHALARGLPGAGLLAARSAAPILPVGVAGSERLSRLWPRPTLVIRIGPPMHIQRPEQGHVDHQAAVDQIMFAIAELLPPSYRGVYAEPPAVLVTGDTVRPRQVRQSDGVGG